MYVVADASAVDVVAVVIAAADVVCIAVFVAEVTAVFELQAAVDINKAADVPITRQHVMIRNCVLFKAVYLFNEYIMTIF